jgi:hypothetical protein
VWKSVDKALQTIVPIAPTHEPWKLHTPTTLPGPVATTTPPPPDNGVTTGPVPEKNAPVVECKGGTPTGAGPTAAQKQGVHNPVNKSYINRTDNPAPPGGVGPLNPAQTKALMTQLGWNESGFRYNIANQYNYLGKYQTGAAVLADQGYIKRDAYALYGNKAVDHVSSWTGKDGITSKDMYLNSAATQEKVMYNLLQSNYKTLVKIGAISPADDLCTVSGMLAASHLIGAGGAKTWRNTGGGQDANGTTGTMYFNMGRYAVDVLSTQTTAAA